MVYDDIIYSDMSSCNIEKLECYMLVKIYRQLVSRTTINRQQIDRGWGLHNLKTKSCLRADR